MRNYELHFNNYEKILIDDNFNIPTLLYSNQGTTYVGYQVYDKVKDLELANSNFKLELGKYDPKNFTKDYRTLQTADGTYVSAIKLTEKFLNIILDKAKDILAEKRFVLPKNILVAEPLTLQKEGDIVENWLALYRKNMRTYLKRKGFVNINFLPEPFAVFQYYKYGKKFAPLNKGAQIVAFVIDFGGGTFDTCIIETSEKGEIREGGKNSKPLGASSIACGGSNLDREILNNILLKFNKGEDAKIKKAYRKARDINKGKLKIESVSEEIATFYKNYNKALPVVQRYKEILTKNIDNWDLNSNPDESIPISLPKNFFTNDEQQENYILTAMQYKKIFVDLYNNQLKKGIKLALERGLPRTKKKLLDYILLSGGSSQIGWLPKLIVQDFGETFDELKFLKLPNYKEVVSAGLAIECARKFYNDTGDFDDVAYNTINLQLNPNNRGIEVPKYKPITLNIEGDLNEGELIPASTNLRKYFNKQLKWRFKLKNEPKNTLKYYFLRNSINYKDTDNLLNLINNQVNVALKSFDKHLEVVIVIKEDGTAYPKFKLNSYADKIEEIEGKPFYIDMTYGDTPIKAESYLGLDFGTTNSSITFISNKHIEKYNADSKAKERLLYENIIQNSPFPISCAAAQFQNETNEELKVNKFKHVFENLIALLYYISLIELKAKKSGFHLNNTKIIRSSGSLLMGFRKIHENIIDTMEFSNKYKVFLKPNDFENFKKAVDFINDYKHDHLSDYSFNFDKVLSPLYKVIERLFVNSYFGFFYGIKAKEFSELNEGFFVKAHGNGIFSNRLKYEDKKTISQNYCYIVDIDNNCALNLFPLVHWGKCHKQHRDLDFGHCYFFDKFEGDKILFSAVNGNCKKEIFKHGKHYSLFKEKLDKFFNEESCYEYEKFNIYE